MTEFLAFKGDAEIESFLLKYSKNPDEILKYNIDYTCEQVIELILCIITHKFIMKILKINNKESQKITVLK